MIIFGLSIAAISFALGGLLIMAAAHHPTGGLGAEGIFWGCVVGFVGGLLLAAVGVFV